MTNTEKRTILEETLGDTYNALVEVDQWDAVTVGNILRNIAGIEALLQGLGAPDHEEGRPVAPASVPAQGKDAPGPAPEPLPDSAPEEEETTPLTKDEVKARLLELSNKYDALDLAAVMAGIGYSRLSDIPPAKYNQLLEKAETAVKELG